MLGIGWPELAVVGIIAFIIVFNIVKRGRGGDG